jgi:predicted  nucleic acid-binding Zn-ribbon protein
MDFNLLLGPVQALLGALCAVLWANLTETKKKAEKVENDLAQYRVHVAETYASSTELKEAIKDINKSFEAYGTKLDARLDRIDERLNKMIEQRE